MSLERGRELSSRAIHLKKASNDLRKLPDLVKQQQELRQRSKRNPHTRFERNSDGATRDPLPKSKD